MKLPVHAGIHHDRRSSPSRGTWIEITLPVLCSRPDVSSPSRGTWIEIMGGNAKAAAELVVPLTGDVD